MKHPPETEAGFMAAVREYAQLRGWLGYHTHDSRRSAEGFPDLVLVRGERIVFAELKSEKGKTTPAQDTWLMALEVVASTVYSMVTQIVHEWGVGESISPDDVPVAVFCWRPSDWADIEKELK